MGHPCVGHSCGALLLNYKSLQMSTVASPERAFRSFAGDVLKNSHVQSAKRSFRTRLPQKLTLRVCKTSVSYETSSNSHASSLLNERFVRNFLQKSRVQSPKRAFRTRHFLQKSPIGAHTSSSPAKQFRDSSPSKPRSHANP